MSRLLDEAIARQAPRTTSRLEANAAIEDREYRMVALSMSYRMGRALVAFCDANPALIAGNEHLVESIRQAMARDQFITSLVVALWAEVPETLDVQAESEETT